MKKEKIPNTNIWDHQCMYYNYLNIIKEYNKQIYDNKLCHLEDMINFLQSHNLPKRSQGQTNN